MNKHTKRFLIVWAALLLLMVGICTYVFLNNGKRRMKSVKRQLSNKYDITFADDESNSDVDDLSMPYEVHDNRYYVRTSDGCSIYGTCNWYGKVTSDTYANIYYGQEYLEQIQDEIGPCFNDCVMEIKTDDFDDVGNDDLKINSKSVRSYEDYVEYAGQMDLINIHVFVRESESMENIASALRILNATPHDFSVSIYAISEDDFAIHQRIAQNHFWTMRDIFYRDDLAWESDDAFFQFSRRAMGTYETVVGRYRPAYDECEIKEDGEWVEVS